MKIYVFLLITYSVRPISILCLDVKSAMLTSADASIPMETESAAVAKSATQGNQLSVRILKLELCHLKKN